MFLAGAARGTAEGPRAAAHYAHTDTSLKKGAPCTHTTYGRASHAHGPRALIPLLSRQSPAPRCPCGESKEVKLETLSAPFFFTCWGIYRGLPCSSVTIYLKYLKYFFGEKKKPTEKRGKLPPPKKGAGPFWPGPFWGAKAKKKSSLSSLMLSARRVQTSTAPPPPLHAASTEGKLFQLFPDPPAPALLSRNIRQGDCPRRVVPNRIFTRSLAYAA